jgi:hypothetical protein
MPVARLAGQSERAGNLFHYKKESGETYHKPVNPWAFAKEFNERVQVDEGMLEKADTQPMPEHVPVEEKSARVVALQLIKRNRDIAFRDTARRNIRKPPSVALAAIAVNAGPVAPSLVDEVINVANAIRTKLREKTAPRRTVVVRNPAYAPELFTDRWPIDLNRGAGVRSVKSRICLPIATLITCNQIAVGREVRWTV